MTGALSTPITATDSSDPIKSYFLGSPGETLNKIYRLLLTTKNAWNERTRSYAPLHPAILRVNHQIHSEAVNILHGENLWILVTSNAPELTESGSDIPVLSTKNASCIRYPALRVHFETPPAFGSIQPTFKSRILAEESLTYLTRSLWEISVDPKVRWQRYLRASLALVLGSSPFHSRAFLLSRYLEDFRLVRDLHTITVTGNIEPTYRKELLRCARSPFTSNEAITAISNDYLRQGDEAHASGRSRTAWHIYILGECFASHATFSLVQHRFIQGLDYEEANRGLTFILATFDSHRARKELCYGWYESVKQLCLKRLNVPNFPLSEKSNLLLCKCYAHAGLREHDEMRKTVATVLELHVDKVHIEQAMCRIFPNSKKQTTLTTVLEVRGTLEQERAKEEAIGEQQRAAA